MIDASAGEPEDYLSLLEENLRLREQNDLLCNARTHIPVAVCPHGKLRRSCETCEALGEWSRVKAKLDRLRVIVREQRQCGFLLADGLSAQSRYALNELRRLHEEIER